MNENKTAAPVLEHRDGKEPQAGHETPGSAYMVYSPARGVKSFLLACGAVAAALGSLWWLCAIIEGTAGGVTGPIGMAIICGWLARELAQAAERGHIDSKTDAEV